jgi:hypothetical protein
MNRIRVPYIFNNVFCRKNCKWLEPTEKRQDELKRMGRILNHRCMKYLKFVKHEGFHPDLVKLDECKRDNK